MELKIDPTRISARVYKKSAKGVMYVKVDFPDLGVYINSFTVQPSQKYEGLWIQPPKSCVYGKWITIVEFSKISPLRELIDDAINRAVDDYQHEVSDATVLDDADPVAAIQAIFPGAELQAPSKKPSI